MPDGATKKTKSALKRLLLLAVILLAGVYIFFAISSQITKDTVRAGNQKITVEIVKSDQDKARGLSGRPSLAFDHGMLFVYDQPGNYSFWMKDMRFPLDIIWINQNKTVVHIEHNVTPESYPQTFSSPQAAQYVLEIPAGQSEEFAIREGDKLKF